MVYVFDTNSFIVLSHYFPERFPSFWINFNEYVLKEKIISVKDVFRELDVQASKLHLLEWIKINKSIFLNPDEKETNFVKKIFSEKHFQYLISESKIKTGKPVADPFVIASAKIKSACVVTEETMTKNAARIPNVCEHFKIDCTNLEGFMKKENWRF